MTPDDRQSYFEDFHILQDRFHRTPGSTSKGYLSKGYCSLTSTLRRVGNCTQ